MKMFKEYWAVLAPILRLLWRAGRWYLIGACVLNFVLSLAPVFLIFVTANLIDSFAALETSVTGVQKSPSASIIVLLISLLVGGSLLSQILERISMIVRDLFNIRFTNYVKWLIAKKAAGMDLPLLEDAAFNNELRTAADEANYKPVAFVDGLLSILSSLVTLVTLSLLLIAWQPWIVPVILVASLSTLFVSSRFASLRVAMVTERAEVERKKWYLYILLTSDQGAKEIRLFGLQGYLLKKLKDLLDQMYQQDRRLITREIAFSGGASLVSSAVQGGLIVFTALQALQQTISVGEFSLYQQSIMQLEGQAVALMLALGSHQENRLFSKKLLGFLDREPFIESNRTERIPIPTLSNSAPTIRFEKVSFRYPNTDRLSLDSITFELRPGEVVAIVGENGAGKSTLVKLMAGLYTPTSGHIFLNDVSVEELDRDDLRSKLSVAFQDFTVFHFSALENIAIGNLSEYNDLETVTAIAKRSGLDKVITQLPDGYDTVLGRFWERGHELSGGQKQLVAITRSLLRNAPILILDEPSAALDVFTEQKFFQELFTYHKGEGKAVLFISHRFTTVRKADRILVIKGGKLIEQGSHQQLIQQMGYYADMYALQASLGDQGDTSEDTATAA
jgi:ATP-binding cassette, subfamily B, bacterial